MKEFVIPPVISDHPKVDEVLGMDWLRQQVDAALAAGKGKQKLHPSTMSPKFGWIAHPLVSEAKQNAIDGARTLILDGLEIDLEALTGVPLPSNLGQRLRDEHDFSKVAYELRIAAGFCRLGHYPVWYPPVKKRHPEFLLLTANSSVLSVECKKRDVRDGYEQDAAVFWKHLQYPLRQRLEEASLNYWIKVSGREFHLPDVETLATDIISAVQENECGRFDCVSGRYHVEYLRLALPGESLDMELVNLFPRGDFGINLGRGYRAMVGPVKSPRLLRMELTDDPKHRVKGILRNLKYAAKQVVPGLPNLIYLDVNMPEYEREQVEFPKMTEAVGRELTARHRHVSAVVLTNIYPAVSLDGHLGWWVSTELLVQPMPRVQFPTGLISPGDTTGSSWLPGSRARPV